MLLGKEAAKTNKPLALNFSAPFIAQFFKDQLDSVLPYVDYVIANESEAEAYAQSHDLKVDHKDVVAIAKEIVKLPKENKQIPRTVIFTQGTEPTVTVTDLGNGEVEVHQYPVEKLAKEQVVDTNGAGDAFAAGFIASLVQGKTLDKAVDVGQWAAKLSIQQVGPTFPFPKETYE